MMVPRKLIVSLMCISSSLSLASIRGLSARWVPQAPATCVVTRARQAGIPAVALLDVYESVTRHSYPLEENRRLRMLEVLVQLLKWTFEEPQVSATQQVMPVDS